MLLSPLTLLKKPNLAETQKALAQAVRNGNHFAHPELPPHRLAVYSRLVRNNTLGFIDRCFVETPHFLTENDWAEIKERFVREGNAHSPYFQDIAAEFLQFCQQHQCVDNAILALMDFEQTQLLAEVSMETVPAEFEWDFEQTMRLSQAAFIREYAVDFIHSQFSQLEERAVRLIVWRDSEFNVLYQRLSEIDFLLLNLLAEQPRSLNGLIDALCEMVSDGDTFTPLLVDSWQRWVNNDVILPN